MGELLVEVCRQVRLGELARARELLGDAALATITPEVWERIRNLLITKTWREAGGEPCNPTDEQLQHALRKYRSLPDVVMDSEIVEARTRGAPRGKGPGPDEITYEILKLALKGKKSWGTFCKFLAAIANSQVPPQYIRYLNYIPIVAQRKPPKAPGGREGIRPRGGPPCHTRLLESALVRQARPEYEDRLRGRVFGIVREGTEHLS